MKLRQKLVIYYLIATLLTLLCVGYAVLEAIKSLSISAVEKQLIDQSNLAEIYISQMYSLQSGGSGSLSSEAASSVINKLGLVLGNVRIYDKDMKLKASSKGNYESSIADSENQKILSTASKGNYAYIVRNSTAYFASPVYAGNNAICILEIIYPMNFFFKNLINGVTNILFIGVVMFTIIMTLLSIYIATRVTKPINRLAAAAENYANRNFTPVKIESSGEISQLCRNFNSMGTQLQDYIERQKSFVSNVSHELRTPLTAIKGYSEFLKDEIKDRPDLQKAVYHLNNESNRLARLVDQVLVLSRIDSDREKFFFTRLNLSRLTVDTIEKMRLRSQKYGINVISRIEPDIYILGDSEKLIQVIVNVLDNAFKFSPAQSSVWVKLYANDKNAVLSVTDQGIGIPHEDMTKVFDRFYRAGNARSISGTGLGLSISKYIIDEHKGTIELLSESKEGTTVKIILPMKM